MSAHRPSRVWREEYREILRQIDESPEWGESVEMQGGPKRFADIGAAWEARDAIMSIYLGRYRGDCDDEQQREAEQRIRELRTSIANDLMDLTSELHRLAWNKRVLAEKAEREAQWTEAMG